MMIYEEVRQLLLRQWTYTGGPNEAKASAYYHDDALLEFPQSGERFRGRANIEGWRQRYPARLDFEPRRIRGGGDLWVAEAGLRYDGGEPVSIVKILQFRGDRIERETLYFADPFPAPDRRRPWAEDGTEADRPSDLPARVGAGTEDPKAWGRPSADDQQTPTSASRWSGQARCTRTRAPELRTRTR
jgi:hypothetical protein